MKEMQLSKQSKWNKQIAFVDDEDFEYLNQFNWHANKQHGSIYAGRCIKGELTQISMHRQIMGVNGGMVIDHIDGNGLNNQKSNLRFCTHKENLRNAKPRSHGNSKYKGVSWNRSHNSFTAKIMINGKNMHVKSSYDEIKCAKAYDKKAKEVFGEFAWLNFPDE